MQTVIRVVYVFVLLMFVLRMLGKRELSKLSPFELVTLMLIPELFQQAMIGPDQSMTNATIGLMALCSLVFLTSLSSFMSPRVQRLLAGEPAVLVRKGKVQERSMALERITPEELLSELHKAGKERVTQVKWAILEDDGRIAIIAADEEKPRGDADDDDVEP